MSRESRVDEIVRVDEREGRLPVKREPLAHQHSLPPTNQASISDVIVSQNMDSIRVPITSCQEYVVDAPDQI